MVGFILAVFIAILTAVSALIATKGPLYDERKKGYGYLTSSGKLVVILSAAIIVLTGAQYLYTDYQEDQSRQKAEKASNERDSVLREDYQKSVVEIKYGFDTSSRGLKSRYDSSTKDIVEALAKYGLKYDSTTKTIRNLVENSTGSPDPDFGFCIEDAIRPKDSSNQKFSFEIAFCNEKAPANNINVVCYGVNHEFSGAYTFAGAYDVISKNSKFSSDESRGIIVSSNNWLGNIRHLFILMKGTYTNNNGTKTYPINEIIVYDFVNKRTGGSTPYFDGKVRDVLKMYGIN